jgi:hypothetical protein
MSVAMNFKISEQQKTLFDYVANAKNITKTSIMKTLIEGYCRDELRIMKEESELATKAVIAKNNFDRTNDEYETKREKDEFPGFIVSDNGY